MKKNFTLNERGDKSVFHVPDGYFEGLTVRMNKAIDRSQQHDQEQTPLRVLKPNFMERYRPLLYMAAMFVLLLFSVSTLLKVTSDKSDAKNLTKETTSSKLPSTPTAEDYLISQLGTDGITEYYVNPDLYEN